MLYEKKRVWWPVFLLAVLAILILASGIAFAKGPGRTTTTTATTTTTLPQPTTTTTTPGQNPQISGSGSLFGDLYVLLRYFGGESKEGIPNSVAIGGEPILSVDSGWQAVEGTLPDGTITYEVSQSGVPSGCIQPVADYERWGDIWPTDASGNVLHQVKDASGNIVMAPITGPSAYETGLDQNRLPLVLTYDAKNLRTDSVVGLLLEVPTANSDGTLNLVIDPYFIQPGGTWNDPKNGTVLYPEGVLWTDLIQPVSFGRISVSRSPEAVLQAAFDEVVNAINSPDTIAIEIDSAGRLLLTKNVYDPYLVDPLTGEPKLIGTVKKAIDSPTENLALYVKLLQDGHLVTPGAEREPIDRSSAGGIPIWKEIAMEDGPSTALRPTIDIQKMRDWGLGALVNVTEESYYAYYTEVPTTTTTNKGKPNQDPTIVPEYKVVAADTVPADLPVGTPVSIGLMADSHVALTNATFAFAASFLAAGADKTGDISVDMIVYLNSILGINLVVGDYAKNPVYFDFAGVSGYDRTGTLGNRGEVNITGGGSAASTYTGSVLVLQSEGVTWHETLVSLAGGAIAFDDLGLAADTHFPNRTTGASDILGFTQMADDDLAVIEFIHTFQIPARR